MTFISWQQSGRWPAGLRLSISVYGKNCFGLRGIYGAKPGADIPPEQNEENSRGRSTSFFLMKSSPIIVLHGVLFLQTNAARISILRKDIPVVGLAGGLDGFL
jgi:hypothetical protein